MLKYNQPDIRIEKNALRKKEKKFREALPAQEKAEMDAEILTRVLTLQQYNKSDILFTYISKSIEIDTKLLIQAAWANRKRVAVPRCIPDTREMEFYLITEWDDVKPGAFGVLEPDVKRTQRQEDLSHGLCIVPGLGFDAHGYRLGYGKGYYDRFLARFFGTTVGLCYQRSVQWRLPHGKYDRPVEWLVTERYTREINQNK